MNSYWIGLTVGFFLGTYVGIFAMIILRLAAKEDEMMGTKGILK